MKPLVTTEEGPAELLPKLFEVLEGVADGVGPMVEGEAHALSASAMTRFFSHLHLHDPSTDFGPLLEPVDEVHCAPPLKPFRTRWMLCCGSSSPSTLHPRLTVPLALWLRRTAWVAATQVMKERSSRAMAASKADEGAC